MKKTLSLLFAWFSLCGCESTIITDIPFEEQSPNIIDMEYIVRPDTRSTLDMNGTIEGFYCTSKSSSLRLEVYPSNNNLSTLSYIVNENGDVLYCFKIDINSFISEGVCVFTASNEWEEPIMSGIYDTINEQIEITKIYGNDIVTRASAAAWGCGIAMGIAGGIWSTAAGMVSAGAGFVVGLSYTALAIAACGDL